MGIFAFKKKTKKTDYVPTLALDIGTEFVKALACQFFPSEKKILVAGSGKQRQQLGDMQAGSILDIASVIQNCEEAIAQAEKEAGFRPEQMVLGIGGEMIKGKSTIVNYVRENSERKIDLAELKNIVHQVQWQAFDQIRKELAIETGHEEIEVKLVNAVITKVEIDGQVAVNPIGFQGKKMTLQVFNAFAPLTHFGAMQTVAAELQRDLLAIVAQPYALSRALTSEDGGSLSAIFVDVGGGTTDIAVVENGAVVGMKVFGLGGRTFTKRLSTDLNISFREAEKIKMAYTENRLDKQSREIVQEAFAIDAQVWLAGMEIALQEFEGIETLPSRILLCGGGSKLPEIKKILEEKKWPKKVNFAQMPRVQYLEPSELTSVKDATKKLTGIEYITPMALATLSAEFAGEEPILQKIIKNMSNLFHN